MSALEQYHASLERSRAWFAKNHPAIEPTFELLNTGFNELARCIKVGRDAQDNTHVSLAPLLFIAQRQTVVALDSLASQQAYQAWIILRPGLESGLIIGKWVEDVKNFTIWQNRLQNRKAYQRAFSGPGLAATVLPRSAELRESLSGINDNFIHPNIDYYMRHLRLTDLPNESIEMKVHYFDDHDFHWASVLGMIHLVIVLQECLAKMFAETFVNIEVRSEGYGLADFELKNRSAALAAAAKGQAERTIVHEIGLWPTA